MGVGACEEDEGVVQNFGMSLGKRSDGRGGVVCGGVVRGHIEVWVGESDGRHH